jgi:hypothetical protein
MSMSEFQFTVTFTVDADDYQQATNVLHAELTSAMFPDEIDWQVTFKASAPPTPEEPEPGVPLQVKMTRERIEVRP